MAVSRGLLLLALCCSAVAGVIRAAEVHGGLSSAKHDELLPHPQLSEAGLRSLNQLHAFRLKGASSGVSTSFPVVRGRSALSLPVCEWDATIDDTTTPKCDVTDAYAMTELLEVTGQMKDYLVCTVAKDDLTCKAATANNCAWIVGSSSFADDSSCQSKEYYKALAECLPADTPNKEITAKLFLCEAFGDSQAECTASTSPTCTWTADAERCSYTLTAEEQAALDSEGGATVESVAAPSTDTATFLTPKTCSGVGCTMQRYAVKAAIESAKTNPLCKILEYESVSCNEAESAPCEATKDPEGDQACIWNGVYQMCSPKGSYIVKLYFPDDTDKTKDLAAQIDACQLKATASDCNGTTVEVTDKVSVVRAKVTFADADYDNITSNAATKAAFESDFTKAIAASAGVEEEWVVINGLSKGSMIADFKVIFPPAFAAQSTSFSEKLTTDTAAIFVDTSLQSYNPQPAKDVSSSTSVSVQDAEKSSALMSAAQGSMTAAAVAALAALLLA